MEFSSLAPIPIHKSGSASNCKFSELSEDNTSTVRFLYNSVTRFFSSIIFPVKSSKRAARNGDETRPFEPVLEDFAFEA